MTTAALRAGPGADRARVDQRLPHRPLTHARAADGGFPTSRDGREFVARRPRPGDTRRGDRIGWSDEQRVTVGTLATIADAADAAGARPPAVTVVGDVVTLSPHWR